MKKHIILITLATSMLAACGNKDLIYSAEYYKEHLDEAKLQIKTCNQQGITQNQQTNCQNASTAIQSYIFNKANEYRQQFVNRPMKQNSDEFNQICKDKVKDSEDLDFKAKCDALIAESLRL